MAVAGLVARGSGEIVFKDEALLPLRYFSKVPEEDRHAPLNPYILNMAVWDNVAVGLNFRGGKKTMTDRVTENSELVHRGLRAL